MNALFIGYGRMGSSIGESWLAAGLVDRVLAIDPNAQAMKAECFKHLDELPTDDIQLIVIAVKPGYVAQVLRELPEALVHDATVISVAAGIPLATLRAANPAATMLVRVMPNTPVLVDAGCTALYSEQATPLIREQLGNLFGAVGNAYWVDAEADLDLVTAISGSGPAYFHLFCEAMLEAAITQGMNQDLARHLIIDTAWGAARLQQQPEARFDTLRQAVTSPNGTTAAAIAVFEQDRTLRDLVSRAVAAAWQRSRELSLS